MEHFKKEVGGLRKTGGIRLPSSHKPIPLNRKGGGLGGDQTSQKLRPWIKDMFDYQYEDGEKEWEQWQLQRLEDEALGGEESGDEEAEAETHPETPQRTERKYDGGNQTDTERRVSLLERINNEEAAEDLSLEVSHSGHTEDILNFLNTSPQTRENVRRGLRKESSKRGASPKSKAKHDVMSSLEKLNRRGHLTPRKDGDLTPFRLPQQRTRQTLKAPTPEGLELFPSFSRQLFSPIQDQTTQDFALGHMDLKF